MLHIWRIASHKRPPVDDGTRWCFVCRRRQAFERVLLVPDDPDSWYGPTPMIRCMHCKTADGDLFPGRAREWE